MAWSRFPQIPVNRMVQVVNQRPSGLLSRLHLSGQLTPSSLSSIRHTVIRNDKGIKKKMNVDFSELTDFDAWIRLAKEVEPLFGPMADDVDFQEALKQAILDRTAFCIRSDSSKKDKPLKGGIVISKESNEIAWLAVSQQYRRMGYGQKLIKFAISKLNAQESVYVQTFDKSVPEGKPARKLYLYFGFTDFKDGGLNPAGVSTVIMKLSGPITD